MKLKLKEIYPNPFKKEINKGELDENIIEKLMSNMKELGLMGSLPVFKRGEQYFLIAGHHRLEALKRCFGEDYGVEVVVHDYSKDSILRGMVVENLTQRDNDFKEELDNLLLIRKYLKTCPPDGQVSKGKRGPPNESDSTRSISEWLNKQGEVLSKSKIANILRIADNMNPELLSKVEKASSSNIIDETALPVKTAVEIASLPKEEQEKISKLVMKSGLDTMGRDKLIREYKNLDDEAKQRVLSGEVSIVDLQKGENIGTNSDMLLTFNRKANDLVLEMRQLRKALFQFRNEKMFENFDQKQRTNFKIRLSKIKSEYRELVEELERNSEVLSNE